MKLKNHQKSKFTREWVRDYISDLVTKGVVKTVLAWIAKKAAFMTTGPLGWLTSLIIEQIWDYFGDKMVRWAVRKGALFIDKVDGNIKAVKIKNARGKGGSDYDDAVDDVFN